MNSDKILSFCEEYLKCTDDGKLFWKKSPSKNIKEGIEAGYITRKGYRHVSIKRKRYYSHRLVWLIHYKKFPIKNLDHINGVKLDNRIGNLRELSVRENAHNRIEHRSGKPVGASFRKNAGNWQASIQINGKLKYLGCFSSREAAHNRYMQEFNKLFKRGIK